MSKIVHKVTLERMVGFQTAMTFGGRIVQVSANNTGGHGIDLYFEVDKDVFHESLDCDRFFIITRTGVSVSDCEHVGTLAEANGAASHIWQQISEAKDEPKQEVLSEHGQATTLSYDVLLYKNRDLVMVARVSATAALDLLDKYTEMLPVARAEYMQVLRVEGHGETIGHVVNGQTYSMRFTKIEA